MSSCGKARKNNNKNAIAGGPSDNLVTGQPNRIEHFFVSLQPCMSFKKMCKSQLLEQRVGISWDAVSVEMRRRGRVAEGDGLLNRYTV